MYVISITVAGDLFVSNTESIAPLSDTTASLEIIVTDLCGSTATLQVSVNVINQVSVPSIYPTTTRIVRNIISFFQQCISLLSVHLLSNIHLSVLKHTSTISCFKQKGVFRCSLSTHIICQLTHTHRLHIQQRRCKLFYVVCVGGGGGG